MIRHSAAAKLVLRSPEGIVLPYGESGRYNLPGGGIDDGETPLDALSREIDEELGCSVSAMAPVWLGERTFLTTDKTGEPQLRRWNIFVGHTGMKLADFHCGDDIQGVTALTPEELYSNSRVTASTKFAVALAISAARGLLLQSPAQVVHQRRLG